MDSFHRNQIIKRMKLYNDTLSHTNTDRNILWTALFGRIQKKLTLTKEEIENVAKDSA